LGNGFLICGKDNEKCIALKKIGEKVRREDTLHNFAD